MQAFCACIQNYTILSYLSIEVNEVHVLLHMAMTPVSNVQVQNCNNRVSWCTFWNENETSISKLCTGFIALFPGHSCVQFLIACSMQTVSDQTLDSVQGLRTRLLELPSQFQCCVPVRGSLGLIWYELGNARDLQIKNVYTLVLLCYPFHKQLHIQLR